jgi:hypothetical protein
MNPKLDAVCLFSRGNDFHANIQKSFDVDLLIWRQIVLINLRSDSGRVASQTEFTV